MLGWVLTLLLIAIVAALFGFNDVAGVAGHAAELILYVALILFLVSVVVGVASAGRLR
jgi:uncharacterized membrane protein YtjA (UPF0391 family)